MYHSMHSTLVNIIVLLGTTVATKSQHTYMLVDRIAMVQYMQHHLRHLQNYSMVATLVNNNTMVFTKVLCINLWMDFITGKMALP